MGISDGLKRFAAYYVTGWGTEVSKTRGPYVFTPAFTKTDPTSGQVTASGGVSLGVLQIDLSQRTGSAAELRSGYGAWAQSEGRPAISLSDLTASTNQLMGEKGRALNEFLATASGRGLVDGWNAEQTARLIRSSPSSNITEAGYFLVLSDQHRAMIATATYKANNARGDTAGERLVAFMNGAAVNGIQIGVNDNGDQIADKFRQVIQTKLTPSFGSIAQRDTLLTLEKAEALFSIYSSSAFTEARTWLENGNNPLTGAGANEAVQTQLSVLRVLSMSAIERTRNGNVIPFQDRLLKDPLTRDTVFYTGGSDPALQAALVISRDGHGGWLMRDGEMVRYQDGEVVLRFTPDSNGRLRLSAVQFDEMGEEVANIPFLADQDAVDWMADSFADLARLYGATEQAATELHDRIMAQARQVEANGLDALKDFLKWSLNGLAEVVSGSAFASPLLRAGDDAVLADIEGLFHTAETTVSPLILDLDGDGVETTALGSGAYFDHSGDRFAEQSGWVGTDDGLLAWDRDGDGRIGAGSELFGSETLLSNGQKAANAFDALVELDSNRDGKLDASDAAFSSLKVWKDLDGDGYTSQGELLTLAEAGVQSVATGYTTSMLVDANGNAHKQIGSFTRIDGSNAAAADVWFKVDTARSVAKDWIAIPDDVVALPDARGFGKVADLSQAMARDVSGQLKSLVSNFANVTSVSARETLLQQIIYKWAGVEAVDPGSRAAARIYGNAIGDARKLASLEAFLGEDYVGIWCWGTPDPNPHGQAAPILLLAYDQLFEAIYGELSAQSHLKSVYEKITFAWDPSSERMVGDLSLAASALLDAIATDPATGKAKLTEFTRTLKGIGALTTIDTDNFVEAFQATPIDVRSIIDAAWMGLVGTGGNDSLRGGAGIDTLRGLDGQDTLVGLQGNDVLDGGTGNDRLEGGSGDDTYVFARGFGQDTVSDSDSAPGNSDVISFVGDIAPSEIVVTRDGSSLYLSIDGTEDRIKLENWFSYPATSRFERVEFSDGTIWDQAALEARIVFRSATEASDVLYGSVGSDTVDGLGGNDIIFGNTGDDQIDGGAGNDMLEGGAGNDVYVFGRGSGADIVFDNDATAGNADALRFRSGVSPADISVRVFLKKCLRATRRRRRARLCCRAQNGLGRSSKDMAATNRCMFLI